MRRRPLAPITLTAVALVALCAGCRGRFPSDPAEGTGRTTGRPPRLAPDYTNLVIPKNIAPLNFAIQEPGTAYLVRMAAGSGAGLEVRSLTNRIVIPEQRWRALLTTERATVTCQVYARTRDGVWQSFAPTTNTVGPPIDPYLVYRLIGPVFSYYRDIHIVQRELGGFEERTLLSNEGIGNSCINCHSFWNRDPRRMTVGVRGARYGNSALVTIDGRTTAFDGAWGYNAWHPGGQAVAYSANKVRQFFHDAGTEVRDVVDLDSDLLIYRADTGKVETDPAIADANRLETYPTWSPDGKALYFCSAPILWANRNRIPAAEYPRLRYELRRVTYDFATHRFGRPEVVLSPAQTGLSILEPRLSPDGRWLLFCMCKYGCFPVFQPSSDLYLMDLATRRYCRLEINSDQSESWHSWSSDSRWIAFSSKRPDGVFTRTYLAHVDESGGVSKAFVLPQRDPTFYDSCLKTFSVPEFATGRVAASASSLARAARSSHRVKLALPPGVWMKREAAAPPPASAEPYRQPGQK